MASLDPQVNLYQINKQLMSKKDPLNTSALIGALHEVSFWMQDHPQQYFMLLCHERRDYTIFDLVSNRNFMKIYPEIKETLVNRGEVLAIDMESEFIQDAYAIWIRDSENSNNLYYLFPYDLGVIRI